MIVKAYVKPAGYANCYVRRRFRFSRVCDGLVFAFFAILLALGHVAVAAVSRRLFLVSRLALGFVCVAVSCLCLFE